MTTAPMSKDEIIAALDEYRSAEAMGAELFRGWAAVCRSPALRGALRMMALREQSHAQVLEERLRELGGQPKHAYESMAGFQQMICSATLSDGEKLAEFMRIAPPEAVEGQLGALADRMSEDPETQALMRTIIDDERATLCSLHAFSQKLCPQRTAA